MFYNCYIQIFGLKKKKEILFKINQKIEWIF